MRYIEKKNEPHSLVIHRKYPKKAWTKALIQREIDNCNELDAHGKYKEYCEVVLYFLKKRYRKAMG